MPLQTFDDIPRPPIPEQEFNTSYFKAEEVNTFVKKARAKSAPGMNGISYKLYKNCPTDCTDYLAELGSRNRYQKNGV